MIGSECSTSLGEPGYRNVLPMGPARRLFTWKDMAPKEAALLDDTVEEDAKVFRQTVPELRV